VIIQIILLYNICLGNISENQLLFEYKTVESFEKNAFSSSYGKKPKTQEHLPKSLKEQTSL
jgi:hypothetical protein